jgi:hypothetical protein
LPPLLTDRNSIHGKVRACFGCNNMKGGMHPLTWLSICPSDTGAERLADLLLGLGEPQAGVHFMLQRRERNKANGKT